mmetsp:Transcript_25057/g.73360  ORF Transcript_25057/g.73360 Transcript_25057/m.73360 type:complete len:1455 (-) Transcript_25057:392-4756(-)
MRSTSESAPSQSRRGGGVRPSLSSSSPPTLSSPAEAAAPALAAAAVPASSSITGPHATPEARLFVDVFLPLALKTDRARSLRKREWKSHLDTGGTHRISPGTAEGWIHRSLRNAPCVKNAGQGRGGTSFGAAQKAAALFKRYKPSYIHAYNASIAHAAGASSSHQHAEAADDATVGSAASSARWDGSAHHHRNDHQFVSQREFRLLVSNLCFHVLAYDAFAIADADGTGRITREEFSERIGDLREHGFETLALIGRGESLDESAYWDPHAVFDRMDTDKGGMVLFGEWATFLKAVELECAVQHRRRQQAIGEEAGAAGGGAFWSELLAVSDLGSTASTTHTTAGLTSAGDSESDNVSVLSGFSLSSTPSLGVRSVASTPCGTASSVGGGAWSSGRALRSTPKGAGRTSTPRGSSLSTPSKRITSIPPLRFSPPPSSSANNSNFDRPQSAVDVSTLMSEIDSLRARLQSAEEELAAAHAECATARGEADDLRTELKDAQSAHTERISMVEFRSDEELVQHRGEAERLASEVLNREEAREDLARLLEECRAGREGSEKEVHDFKQKLEECQAERDDLKGRLNAETGKRWTEVEGLKRELDEARREKVEAGDAASSQIEKMQDELAETKRARDEEVGALMAELSDARSAGEVRASEAESLREELAVVRDAAKEHRSELARTNWKVEEFQGELELMNERCNSYKDLNAKMTKELHFTNDELIRSEEKAERLRWQLDTKVAALQTEAGMAQSEVETASEEMYSERKARAMAEDQNRRMTIDVDILRADLETTKAVAATAEQAETELRLAAKEIDKFKSEVAESRAAIEERDSEIISLRENVRTLESEQCAQQAAAVQHQKETEGLRAEVSALRLRADLETAKAVAATAEQAETELRLAAKEIDKFKSEVAESRAAIEERDSKIISLRENVRTLESEQCAQQAAAVQHRKDTEGLRAEVSALRFERDGALEEARGASLRVSELRDEVRIVSSEREEHVETIRVLEADVGEMSQQNERLSEASAKLIARSAAHASEREKLARDLESCQRERATLEGQRRGQTEKVEELSEETTDGETLQADIRSVESSIRAKQTSAAIEGTKENGTVDRTRVKSRSLDFGDKDGRMHVKKSCTVSVFVYVFSLLIAVAYAFLVCSRGSCPSMDCDGVADEDLAAGGRTAESEQTIATEVCPSIDNFTAAISSLESTLRQRQVEYEEKTRECETELRQREAEYEAESRECELEATRLSTESDAVQSSFQACLDEIEAHRNDSEECHQQLETLEDAKNDMELSLSSARLSLNDCEVKWEAEEASVLSIRTDYYQLASQCKSDAAESNRVARANEAAKQDTKSSLELCEESSRAEDATASEMQITQYDLLVEEHDQLSQDNEGSEQPPLRSGADHHAENTHGTANGELSARRRKLGSKVKVSRDKKGKHLADAKSKRTTNEDEDLDWIGVFWAF